MYSAGPGLGQVLGDGSVPVQFPLCVVELQQALSQGVKKYQSSGHCSVTHAAVPL